MNIEEQIKEFKQQFDQVFKNYVFERIVSLEGLSADMAKVIQDAHPMWLEGGKRIRPFLAHLAYESFGGKEKDASIFAGMSLEMLHLFALVHDDIIDVSETRRGFPTLHTLLSKRHKKTELRGDSEHAGSALALLIGDLMFSYANQIITKIPFESHRALATQNLFYEVQQELVAGEYEDMRATAHLDSVGEKEIIQIMSRKSGRYSIERPFQFGAVLAGITDKNVIQSFSSFSVPIGIAFQLQDDLLGTFGKEEKIGKPVDSDIRQGKPTIMAVYALAHAPKEDVRRLLSILGNQKASLDDILCVKQIFIATGAKKYAETMAKRYIEQARSALQDVQVLPKKFIHQLIEFADYIVKRST